MTAVDASPRRAPAVTFPLSAIVGQEQLVQALLINAVAPEVGGLLVRGERGTAKTTAVRGLAALLAPVPAAADQPFAFGPGDLAPGGRVPAGAPVVPRAAPLVELPLGTTLDRLVGSLDLGRALAGERAFEPGLLARAHRGILYVDEVNLLADHLVDALLDAAATGVARVEREAVSVTHDARFLLVGTMNVEEGDLRPQLLDRFGLGVEVTTPTDPAVRAEVVRRRLAFERDPVAFAERFGAAERELEGRIAAARDRVERVTLSDHELLRITGACARLGVDGVRGDIVTARAARALAALDGRDEVAADDVRRAATLALAHRRRRDPLDGRMPDEEDLHRALDEAGDDDPSGDDPPPGAPPSEPPPPGAPPAGTGRGSRASGEGSADPSAEGSADPRGSIDRGPTSPALPARERRDHPLAARLPAQVLTLAGRGRGPLGRRARSAGPAAGAIDTRPVDGASDDLAVVATLQARLLGAGDVREHVRAGREAVLLCLVVDASGSMGTRRRAARVKGALLGLLRDAYARRDRVALIAFRHAAAQVVVAPGAPIERAAATLAALPTGGRTPLASGLWTAGRVIARERARDATRRSIVIVLTDGRLTGSGSAALAAAAELGRAADAVELIDTEDGPVRVGLCRELARAAGGRHHRLPQTPPSRRAA
ncbi:MAG TPA: VWA domain-containing protein [Solirubrobacteraceae bacterium]|nr:VWA domain-containing protein [Solirubrobacteraceae bacterium]